MMACCHWRFPIWLLLAFLVFQSCATRKVTAPSSGVASSADMESFLHHGPYAWDWFSCSGQMRMESSFFSGSGQYNLRMKSDSLVWMVVKYMGLEVARLQATADSVVLINRWERKVEVYSWAEIRRQTGFPASLYSLQRLVMGWLPLKPEQWEQTGQDEGATLIQARESGIQIQAAIEAPPFRLTRCLFREQGSGMEIRGRQEGWASLQGKDFSHARYWEMKPDPDSRVFLQVLIQDGSFSGPLQFPFSIPDRYARGD